MLSVPASVPVIDGMHPHQSRLKQRMARLHESRNLARSFGR